MRVLAFGVFATALLGCAERSVFLGERRTPPEVVTTRHVPVQLAAGELHTCALFDDGEVECWGDAARGQLGAGSSGVAWTPRRVPGVVDGVAIAAASALTCVLTRGARVRCWGRAGGDVTFDAASELDGSDGADAIAVGFHSLCVHRANGSVACRPVTRAGAFSAAPGVARAEQVVAGWDHACALMAGGRVRCWGDDRYGELGDGGRSGEGAALVDDVDGAIQIHASRRHSCAWSRDGRVRCWGDLHLGEPARSAVSVPGAEGLAGFAASRSEACGWFGDGRVECLAHGASFERRTIAALRDVVQVVAGGAHFCALSRSGAVACWGNGDRGALGDPDAASASPREIPGVYDAVAVALEDGRACVVRRAGAVTCWGALAIDGRPPAASRAVDLPRIDDAIGIASAESGACALLRDGRVACWSRAAQAIDPSARWDATMPAVVPGLAGATQIAVGDRFGCARIAGGSVRCWGANYVGQLGDGTLVDRAAATVVAGAVRVAEIAATRDAACARTDAGSVLCWGYVTASQRTRAFDDDPFTLRPDPFAGGAGGDAFDLDLGFRPHVPNPSPAHATSPIEVAGHEAVRRLFSGSRLCASRGDDLVCWSEPDRGPAPVRGLEDAAEIAVTTDHACARHAGGTVACWGENDAGQLGRGAPTGLSPEPQNVPGLTRAVAVAVAYRSSCALIEGGSVRCWGVNDRGQLGDGSDRAGLSTPRIIEAW